MNRHSTGLLPAAITLQPGCKTCPPGVDACGENGEFHTFVYAGPNFRQPIAFIRGARGRPGHRFYYCNLIPAEDGHEHLATAHYG
ncbi:MAG: hypothetical protein KGL13_09975 [Gammaproteobacteria bacterium]|nr:hypothetical protein [Gammaproteobacteria bacterium]